MSAEDFVKNTPKRNRIFEIIKRVARTALSESARAVGTTIEHPMEYHFSDTKTGEPQKDLILELTVCIPKCIWDTKNEKVTLLQTILTEFICSHVPARYDLEVVKGPNPGVDADQNAFSIMYVANCDIVQDK